MPEITLPARGWKPRDYQYDLWQYRENGGKRAVAVWHRRAGKDLFAINRIAYESLQRVGLYWHCFPTYSQGRKIAWDGATKEGNRFLDAFPEDIIQTKHNNEMKIELKNGSIYQVVGTDNPDRLIGSNPIGVVFSEYSVSDPKAWELVRPILVENGGWALFIYTPRGKNHGWELLQMARSRKHWFCQVLGYKDTKAVSEEQIEEERLDGMTSELIDQEFNCSFDAPLVGSYYGAAMAKALLEKRITNVPYDPAKRVSTAWDLGIGDSTSIWFYQIVGLEIHIIDFYENSGEGLAHYAKILLQQPYVYEEHHAPHDVEARELGTGKTLQEIARALGIKFRVGKKLGFEDGIEAVRNILNRCWFDEGKCGRGIEALRQYRKEWNDEKKVFTDRPVHDWTSHPCDAMRYLALTFKDRSKKQQSQQLKAIDEYSDYHPGMINNY